ncbi:hypothetical protein E4T43_04731 [Aureobasidium subglaciale]|nr:hypothetical protein E4T43_04731 [Aureobasidium subglaciale]
MSSTRAEHYATLSVNTANQKPSIFTSRKIGVDTRNPAALTGVVVCRGNCVAGARRSRNKKRRTVNPSHSPREELEPEQHISPQPVSLALPDGPGHQESPDLNTKTPRDEIFKLLYDEDIQDLLHRAAISKDASERKAGEVLKARLDRIPELVARAKRTEEQRRILTNMKAELPGKNERETHGCAKTDVETSASTPTPDAKEDNKPSSNVIDNSKSTNNITVPKHYRQPGFPTIVPSNGDIRVPVSIEIRELRKTATSCDDYVQKLNDKLLRLRLERGEIESKALEAVPWDELSSKQRATYMESRGLATFDDAAHGSNCFVLMSAPTPGSNLTSKDWKETSADVDGAQRTFGYVGSGKTWEVNSVAIDCDDQRGPAPKKED